MKRDWVSWEAALVDVSVAARFMSHVHVTCGCWVWTGAISHRGHGRFNVSEGFTVIAHRYMYALAYGLPALQAAEVVAHECDNPVCVNPVHLSESTVRKNTRDGVSRRSVVGSALRDTRGAKKRALAIRDAARESRSITDAMALGISIGDAGQLALIERDGVQSESC